MKTSINNLDQIVNSTETQQSEQIYTIILNLQNKVNLSNSDNEYLELKISTVTNVISCVIYPYILHLKHLMQLQLDFNRDPMLSSQTYLLAQYLKLGDNYTLQDLDVSFIKCQALEYCNRVKSISNIMVNIFNYNGYQISVNQNNLNQIYNSTIISDHAKIIYQNQINDSTNTGFVNGIELKIDQGQVDFISFRYQVAHKDLFKVFSLIKPYCMEENMSFSINKIYQSDLINRSLLCNVSNTLQEVKSFEFINDRLQQSHRLHFKEGEGGDNNQNAILFLKNSYNEYINILNRVEVEKTHLEHKNSQSQFKSSNYNIVTIPISNNNLLDFDQGKRFELTLIPSVKKRHLTEISDAKYLENTQEVANIHNFYKYQQMMTFYDSNEFKICQDEFYCNSIEPSEEYEGQNMFKNVIKKLSQNVMLNPNEKIQFFENFKIITKELFKVSKLKQLYVFLSIMSIDPSFQILATSSEHYLIIKNQQQFELQIPESITYKQITNFVLLNVLDLAKDNLGVILVQLNIRFGQLNDYVFQINKMLSFQHQFKQIEYNFNTIELYKTLVCQMQIDTTTFPEQKYFFKQVNDNLCVLYEKIIQKELLWQIFRYSKTEDLQDIILTLSQNVTLFFDNIQGIHIIKTIFEIHRDASTFKIFYEALQIQLETILTSRQLNLLWFQFLENKIQNEQTEILLVNTEDIGMQTMIRLLESKIGFNSICALIEKQGYDAINPKLQKIKEQYNKMNIQNCNSVLIRSINNLEKEHLNTKTKKKYLIYDFVKKHY